MTSFRQFLATSEHSLARSVREIRRAVRGLSVPAPRPVIVPARWTYDTLRKGYWYGLQHFVCEPYFKSYCSKCGERLRTGCFLHFILGSGDILVGDDVVLDGRVVILFAARFTPRPSLEIGNRTDIGHLTRFTIGKRITIGNDVLIGPEAVFFDSPGHPSDPTLRRQKSPGRSEDVRPITIEDNTLIGTRAIVGMGVTIGQGSIVAAGSVIMGDVPPNTVMAGNPARKIAVLKPEEAADARSFVRPLRR